MKTILLGVVAVVLISGCGHKLGQRHFAGPITPAAEISDPQFEVGDDRSITFTRDRLEISLLPLTPEMLNRQFAEYSKTPEGFTEPNPYVRPLNPFTYGDWEPPEGGEPPPRFSVFRLKVVNHSYPKVWLDPLKVELVTGSGRNYASLSYSMLVEYFRPYARGFSGNDYMVLNERQGVLLRTLYPGDEMVFAGQEGEGFVLFSALDRDVEDMTVWIRNVVLRFDYKGEPVETVDIPYHFSREVYVAQEARSQSQ
jgi:hypothetical protein